MKPHTIIVAGVTLAVTVALAATPIANLILTGNMDAGGFRITNLGAPSASADAATKGYADGKVSLSGSYADPTWLTSLDWTKIDGKPTTLSGYGITDAQPLDTDLSAIAALATTLFGRSLLTQADAPAVRSLIGLGGAALLNVGTTTGTVAAGDDSRIINAVQTTGSYSNPAWISALAWSKITGAPAFITGNQSITLTGAVTGTGTTSISTTLAADQARANLTGGTGTLNLSGFTVTLPTVPIAQGGTAATTAAGAFANLKQPASTSATGVVQIATDIEVQGMADSLKTVVSSSLGAWWTWIKTQAQTVAGAWTFAGNLVAQANFTGGSSSGNSATLNWGSVTAPNLPGFTQRGFTTTFPDASGRLISAGNPQDYSPTSQPIPLNVALTYRTTAAFYVNGYLLATSAGFTAIGGSTFQAYTVNSTAGLGDMMWADFGHMSPTFQAGGAFPTARKIIFTGRMFCAPFEAPNNNGRVTLWIGNAPRAGVGITSITRSGATATATSSGHLLAAGAWVRITGATEADYNGYFQISNVTANTFDYTVTGTPSSPATGSPTWTCSTIGGFGITMDSGGIRLAGVTTAPAYTETVAATGLSAVINNSFVARYFWLIWNGDGTASLYLADQASGATTSPPSRPSTPALTLSGLGGATYRSTNLVLAWVGTGSAPTNQGSWGLANFWLHQP